MEFGLPRPIENAAAKIPSKLPFEDKVVDGINKVSRQFNNSKVIKSAIRVSSLIPKVRSFTIGGPQGKTPTPEFTPPIPYLPEISHNDRPFLKAAIMDDIAGLVEKIPGVGIYLGPVADMMEDTAIYRIQKSLTPQQLEYFQQRDRALPITTLAALDTIAHNNLSRAVRR